MPFIFAVAATSKVLYLTLISLFYGPNEPWQLSRHSAKQRLVSFFQQPSLAKINITASCCVLNLGGFTCRCFGPCVSVICFIEGAFADQ